MDLFKIAQKFETKLKKNATFEVVDIFKPNINFLFSAFHKLSTSNKKYFNRFMRESFDRIFGTEYADLAEFKFFGYGAFNPGKPSDLLTELERNLEIWHAFFHELLKKEVHLEFGSMSKATELSDHLNEDIVSFFQFGYFQRAYSFFAKALEDKINTDLLWG